MLWQLPPKYKIYEALGVMADGRIEIVNSESEVIEARQYSSSRGKFYTILYNPTLNQIMPNDNATWYVGYLGYPAISLLLFLEKIKYDISILPYFADISFKDINQKHKNDFEQANLEIVDLILARGLDKAKLDDQVDSIFEQLTNLKLEHLGPKIQPPSGY
jgi:hypothetical protein